MGPKSEDFGLFFFSFNKVEHLTLSYVFGP